jgi:hypothetical protein
VVVDDDNQVHVGAAGNAVASRWGEAALAGLCTVRACTPPPPDHHAACPPAQHPSSPCLVIPHIISAALCPPARI